MEWGWVYNVVGVIGVISILVAYYLLQAEKLLPTSATYLKMNIVGSTFILYSLYFDWNLPAAMVEIMWLIISLWGMFKTARERRRATV